MNKQTFDLHQNGTAAENFWRTSSDFYSNPEVNSALLALQNEQNKNINQMLFALWVSTYFQISLEESYTAQISNEEKRAQSWASNIRSLRFEMEQEKKDGGTGEFSQLRDVILETELKMEQIHQQRLVANLLKWIEVNQPAQPMQTDLEELLLFNLAALCGSSANNSDYQKLSRQWLDFCRQQPDK
ncbi:TIGR02444 family protein [Aliikangiella sp. IMCC44359]|uniref:TIGR02444 family protein n=1 Tax=Aliikangiella sp. IMCC44359 TaxID=3459125 RepID=UPI00403AD4B3